MNTYVVCMDSSYIRDAQLYDTKDLTDKEFYDFDPWNEEQEYLWHDIEPLVFIGIIRAKTEKEACKIIGKKNHYDYRCLLAIRVFA